MIFIHEFGHYITARIFKVTIEEFSIGMGPRLISWVSKKTGIRYSISLLPIGGFVAMPGENGEYNEVNTGEKKEAENQDSISDSAPQLELSTTVLNDEREENELNESIAKTESSEQASSAEQSPEDKYAHDPNTFGKKPAWQRFIITAAGATVNILVGFLFMIVLTCFTNIGETEIYYYPDDPRVQSSDKLQIGDVILKVDGKRVKIADEVDYEIKRKGNKPIDFLVIRDGKELLIEDVSFSVMEMQGQEFGMRDFGIKVIEKNFGSVMRYSIRKSALIVRMCWVSLYDLITGRYTFAAVSGPVGISTTIGEAAKQSFLSLLSITVLISINLGVMNLLPIPALDGGRIFTILIEMVTGKKLPPKVEGMINTIGLFLLLGLSFIVLIKDIFQLI